MQAPDASGNEDDDTSSQNSQAAKRKAKQAKLVEDSKELARLKGAGLVAKHSLLFSV